MTAQFGNPTYIDNPIANNIDKAVDEIEKCGDSIIKNDSFDEEILVSNEIQQAELTRFQNDTKLKSILTWFVIAFTTVWSIAIATLLYLIAFSKCILSDKVIITLLTETLITVLGLPLVVTSHFFPKKIQKSFKENISKRDH